MGEQQRGIQRVVAAVWDLDAGAAFYEQLLGATFEGDPDDPDAKAFGVRVLMAWDAGIELVAPIDGVDSWIRTELEANGEGIKGVVFAVPDADEAMERGRALGLSSYHSLDYTQDEIDQKLGGRFARYKEHFVASRAPLSGTVLLGEFVARPR